jgi:hypothetical protein
VRRATRERKAIRAIRARAIKVTREKRATRDRRVTKAIRALPMFAQYRPMAL